MKRLLLLTAAFLASPAAAQSLAITHARVVIGDGSAPIEDATVVIRGGRVVAAGKGVGVPADVPVVDAGGRFVTPGIVAGFTRMGLIEVDGVDEANDEAASNSPFHASIDIALAINPATSAIALNRAEGITRAVVAPGTRGSIFAGQGAVIDLGSDADPVTVPRAFQFMEWGESGARAAGGSRPAAITAFRDALKAAQAYARAPGAYLDQGRDVLVNRADAAALGAVVTGKVPLLIHVERASDMRALIALRGEFPALRLVFVGASEGWLVARELAAAKIPVIASALNDLPEAFESIAATQSNVGRMKAAGVLVGIGTIGDNEARQARLEKQYAGNLVALRHVPGASGLSWDQAFAAITGDAAEAVGMGGDIGTLRPGRRGDVVIWDGDPLELGTAVVSVYVDGVKQSLATRQSELLKRYRQPGEAALPKAYER